MALSPTDIAPSRACGGPGRLLSGPRQGKQPFPKVSSELYPKNLGTGNQKLNSRPTAPTCRRCGTCCQKGGPALHAEDAALFPGALGLHQVLTLRAGEPAHDQPRGRVLPLAGEMLKIKGLGDGRSVGLGGWACLLYDARARACALYGQRPAECRALFCEDTSELFAMYDKDRLTRRDLLGPGHPALAVLDEHEALVPVARIAELAGVFRAGGDGAGDAAGELLAMARADAAFRRMLAERVGIGPEYHDFFFGRGAAALFAAVGVALRTDARTGLRVQPDPLWRTG